MIALSFWVMSDVEGCCRVEWAGVGLGWRSRSLWEDESDAGWV